MDGGQVLGLWVSWLPLQHDLECAHASHAMLAELLESQHPSVMQQLPAVISMLPLILSPDKSLASDTTRQRIRGAVQRLDLAAAGLAPETLNNLGVGA